MTGHYARCACCGAEFYKDAPWKKLCLACWKRQNASSNLVRIDAGELEALRARVSYLEDQVSKLFLTNVRIQQERQSLPSGLGELLKFMLFACHPDRHDGDPRATAATRWLLEARKEAHS